MRTNTDNDIRVVFASGGVAQFITELATGESQATPSDCGCFGPFVRPADKCLICPQLAVCCFWPDHLLRRMSKIEGTLECGVDTLPSDSQWPSYAHLY